MARSPSTGRRAAWSPRVAFLSAVAIAVVGVVGLSALGVLPSAGAPTAGDAGRSGLAPAPSGFAGGGEVGLGKRPPMPARSRTAASPATPSPTNLAPEPLPTLTAMPSDSPSGQPDPWQIADLTGPVLGIAGPLQRYRVAVEQSLPVTATEFAAVVDSTLGDPQSWIASGTLRLQRVPAASVYNFTIYLASPDTAYELCRRGGVDIKIDGVAYTSCRAGDNVVINADRYLGGVPAYNASLEDYRQYVINHEVGHWLGYGHELCPGNGLPAPVMQQQTLGLQGCLANSWPYLDGRRYGGPPVNSP